MKGQPWTTGLPLVTVLQGDPKPVTFVYPYYDNAQFLHQQVAGWALYPEHVRSHLSAIVVDDCSPSPAAPALEAMPHPFQIRLFRIGVDVRWNWLAARNIAMHHAPEGWCLLTDMDHVVPESTAAAVIAGQHDPGVIYGFSREEHTGETLASHPNSFLMTKDMFWKVGGYDEELAGKYGTDGDFRRRCAAVAPIQILADRLVRHERVGDSSTTAYLRKQPEDAGVKTIVAARKPGWRPKVLSFSYEEVPLRREVLACP